MGTRSLNHATLRQPHNLRAAHFSKLLLLSAHLRVLSTTFTSKPKTLEKHLFSLRATRGPLELLFQNLKNDRTTETAFFLLIKVLGLILVRSKKFLEDPNALTTIGAIIQNSYPEKAKKGFFPPVGKKKKKKKKKKKS